MRTGTILLVVSGLAAILATMTLAFLLRMRSDSEESAAFANDVQARLMLTAGLFYVQESARLGWEQEAFGWWDPRDGRAGPKDIKGMPVTDRLTGAPCFVSSDDPATDGYGAKFPAIQGKAARCPMFRMRRPPYAVKAIMAHNEAPLDPNLSWAQLISAEKPNPQPAADTWTDFMNGDRTPAADDAMPGWFRIYRLSKAKFVITCGAGRSLGFRDWNEVVAEGQTDVFGTQTEFDSIRASETILWYEAEWNAAVGSNLNKHYSNLWGSGWLAGHNNTANYLDEHTNARQFGGTFTYIERLPNRDGTVPPPDW